jgi:hypothetical protein
MLKPGHRSADPPLVVGPVHLSFKPIQLVVPPESAGPVLDALRVLHRAQICEALPSQKQPPASRHFFRRLLLAGEKLIYLRGRCAGVQHDLKDSFERVH